MSELAAMLEETVGRLFDAHVTRAAIEAGERGVWQDDLWGRIEEAGLMRPHLAETAGGAGGSWREAHVILRAAGRHALPLPLAEAMLATWLLARAGIAIPEGALTILPEPLSGSALAGDTLSVEARDVPWGRAASAAVFVVPGDDGTRVGMVACRAAMVRPGENIAREPRDTLGFARAPVAALAPATLPADVVRLYGALVRSAQMAGAMEALLAQSVRYAGERSQFGRPIASFQVIQHELAKLAGDVAAAGMAAETAFHAAARAEEMGAGGAGAMAVPGAHPLDPRFEIAVAKTRIGDAVEQATGIAHQVHGAIGFTYEHALHFSTRRLWAWRAEFGTDAWWAGELGRAVLARGADALWPTITGRGRVPTP